MDDLSVIIALARAEADGKPIRYMPGLERAYAVVIAYMADEWQPKPAKSITLTPSDAESRIRHD